MIYLIYGENIYEQELELRKLISLSDAQPEHIDPDSLTMNMLADIVRGGSLFASTRFIIVRGLASNTQLFNKLAEWGNEVSDETTLVLIESKIDRRTKAYKVLNKIAKILHTEPLLERDSRTADEWLKKLAKDYDVKLSPDQRSQMVRRALVVGEKPITRIIDQMQLLQALQALRGCDNITDDSIATVLPPATTDTVFDLLGTASAREITNVNRILSELMLIEDGHRVLALVMSQWAQLVMVAALGGASSKIAVDLGMHPYAAQKSQEIAERFTRRELQELTGLAARLDAGTKVSQMTPWDATHRLLYAIATR